ncbi:hypothetical protein ACLDWX_25405 [Enterobacter kobei]|uniref:hypothetical protein n=1 Tax=Enterobacter kobei TaxID=208224 RepID=UPI00397051ED
MEGATLSFPLEGEFRYRENEKWHRVIPGEIMVVPNARSIDIEYAPSEQSGEFVALSVVLAEEQLEAARLLLAAPPPQDTGSIAAISVSALLSPLNRWTAAMREGKRPLSLHAMVEVVLWLYGMGYPPVNSAASMPFPMPRFTPGVRSMAVWRCLKLSA